MQNLKVFQKKRCGSCVNLQRVSMFKAAPFGRLSPQTRYP
nr:MAG TPA: YABBY protein [Caudoviricetes sp.]